MFPPACSILGLVLAVVTAFGLLPAVIRASDIVFQRSDGTFRLWHLESNQIRGPILITPNHANHDARWRIAGSGIFNGAGNADLLFQYHDGMLAVWYMDEATQTGSTLFYPEKPESSKWRLIGSGDLDGDGGQDLVFQSREDRIHGPLSAWLMRGPHQARPLPVTPSDPTPGFQLRAIGDFDGDLKADLIFQEPGSGALQCWLMNGATRLVSEGTEPSAPDRGFAVQAATDVDGDGQVDLLFQKQKTVGLWKMNRLRRLGEAVDMVLPGLETGEVLVAAGVFLRDQSLPHPPPPRRDEPVNSRDPSGLFENTELHVVARVVREPPGIQLEWKRNPVQRLNIRRRLLTESAPTLMATNVGGVTWLDTQVTPGERYEYAVFDPGSRDFTSGSITASLDGAPIEYRGKALVLVDETVEDKLSQALRDFERDLVGDGWSVARKSVPRHNDNRWSANRPAIEKIRGIIRQEYQDSDGDLRTVILVGHVAVPYTGFGAEDGHTAKGQNHFGAWPTDLYYADTDGRWTDIDRYPLPYETAFPETMNTPDDGKFDQSQVPRNSAGVPFIEVSVGRVDFARLDGYLGERISETSLLKRYFEKNHRYRHGDLAFPPRAIAQGFSHPNENRILYNNAIFNSSRNFGQGPDALVLGDFYRAKRAALWGFQAGFGHVSVMNNNQSNPWSTESVTRPGQAPAIAFYMLSGSWFGDWNLAGNLLRGVLVPASSGLASCWMRGYLVKFDTMAVGGTLGDAFKATANDPNQAATVFGAPRTLSLLGDPTLRAAVTPPPTAASASKHPSGVVVSWQRADGQPLGYFVYDSPFALGPFTNRLTMQPVHETQFLDSNSIATRRYHAVRSVQRMTTGAGAYTNLSQAAFVKKRD